MMVPSNNTRRQTTIAVQHLQDGAAVKLRTADVCAGAISAAAELIADSFRADGKLMLCGNGGSAADCQHLAAEFTSRLSSDFARPGLPALALTTDTSFLTAYANDFDFDGVFARQVQALGKPGDVLLAITTSGGSKNVVRAAEAAKQMELVVIALTGALVVPPSGGLAGDLPGEPRGVRPQVPPPELPPLNGSVRPAEAGTTNVPASSSATPLGPPFRRGGGSMPLLEFADVAICIPSTNTQHIQEAHLAVEHILCQLVERLVFGEHGTGDWGIKSP